MDGSWWLHVIRYSKFNPNWFSAFAVSGSSWLSWHPIGVYRFAASCPAQFPMRTQVAPAPSQKDPKCVECAALWKWQEWIVDIVVGSKPSKIGWLKSDSVISHFWSAFGTPCLRYAQQSVCLLCHQLSLARHAAKPVASSRHAIQPGSKLLGGEWHDTNTHIAVSGMQLCI